MQSEIGFSNNLPEAKDGTILICAWQYQHAVDAYRDLMSRAGLPIRIAGGFVYVCSTHQLLGHRERKMWLHSGWSRLIDAPMIETMAKAYRIQMINYERQ